MKRMSVYIALIAVASPSGADTAVDARSAGLATGGIAITRGISAATWNPANLAVAVAPQWTTTLLSGSAALNNSAFSVDEYDRYNGAYLDQEMKADLLEKIGDNGLNLSLSSSWNLPGVQIGRFAIMASSSFVGSATLARETIDLVLQGSELNEVVSLGSSTGDGIAWSDIGAAYGHRHGNWSFGANFRYVLGHYHNSSLGSGTLQPVEVDGVLTSIATEGFLEIKQAEGGRGFASDLGITYIGGRGIIVSGVISNVFSRVSWTDGLEKRTYTYDHDIDFSSFDEDQLGEPNEIIESIDPFSTNLPSAFEVGIAIPMGGHLTALGDLQLPLNDVGSPGEYDAATGFELALISWLPLRGGYAYNATTGSRYAGGFGIHPGPLRFDIALGYRGGLFGSAKGMDLAMSLEIGH